MLRHSPADEWTLAATIEAILADPLIRLVMRADRVEPQALRALLLSVAAAAAARPAHTELPTTGAV